MCGLFGFVGDAPVGYPLFCAANAAAGRGRDAHGWATLTRPRQQRPRVYRAVGPLDPVTAVELTGRARVIIGHARAATCGRADDVRNAHPHCRGDVAVVHNGWVLAHRQMLDACRVDPRSECDSEPLAAWAWRTPGSAVARLAAAVDEWAGVQAATCLAIIHGVPVGVTRRMPLVYLARPEGCYYASTPFGEFDWQQVRDGASFRMTRRGPEEA